MSTQCLIYARFSPRPDQATSDSNDKQVSLCREYAKRHGYTVEGVYEDRNASRNSMDRDGLWNAIAQLKKGWVLVCHDASRFGSGVTAMTLEAEINKLGACVEFSTGGPVDHDDLMAQAFRQIMYVMDELTRKMIGARTRVKMRLHQQKGRKMSRFPPYGYYFEGKRAVEEASEQAILKSILGLSDAGMNTNRIARTLNDENTPARGERWHPNTINRILRFQEELKDGQS